MPKGQPRVPKALTVEWESPPDLFDALWEEFGGFDLDPACRPGHYTAMRVLEAGGTIYVPTDEHLNSTIRAFHDGLAHDWNCHFFFCNPPWGLALRKWVPYAIKQVRDGHAGGGVMLVPATTDTQWWQDNVLTRITHSWARDRVSFSTDMRDGLDEVRLLRSRLTFSGAATPATGGSALLILRKWKGTG